MTTVISVENLSKTYRLGQIGTGTFSRDLEVWWAKMRGKPNPLLRIGETDHGNRDGEDLWALRDVSFTVEQGEALGIIGRNGAGKSTLLKILSRVTAPTSGEVKVKGRIASLLEVGTGFHPELTGRENITLNGAILGMSKAEVTRKFDEIVDFSGVEQFIDTPVKRYSSGMYVRLAFAVAAHLEPEILIVDEVLAVGDAEFQKKCLGKMGDVAHEGRTVLFVSHNMAAIRNLCGDSIYLKNGQIVMRSVTENSINSYLSDTENILSSVLLRDRKDRQGSGMVKVVNFYVTDWQGNLQSVLKSGGDYLFVLEYEKGKAKNKITNTVCSIGISDMTSHILLFRSNFSNQNLTISNDIGSIECKVEDLNLAQGSYKIILLLSDNDHEVLDFVIDAAHITVDGGDYFGTGSIGLPTHCKVLTRANWKIL